MPATRVFNICELLFSVEGIDEPGGAEEDVAPCAV